MFKTRYLAETFAKKNNIKKYMVKKEDDMYFLYILHLPSKEELNKAYGKESRL